MQRLIMEQYFSFVEKGNDYVIINASNSGGPFDPSEFSLEIIKVI